MTMNILLTKSIRFSNNKNALIANMVGRNSDFLFFEFALVFYHNAK